jgi:hypothetical protein
MKKAAIAAGLLLVLLMPREVGRCLDVHPWNRITSPWLTDKSWWRFHYIKLRFPNFASMEVPSNPDGALPWRVFWEDRSGRRHERTIRWKGGLSTPCVKVCVLTVNNGGE